jgi:hypothetical protein
MTTDFDVERRVGDWLEEGPLAPAQWAVDDAIRQAVAMPRRHPKLNGSRPMRWIAFAGAAAAAVILGVAVIRLAPGNPTGAGSATPSPSPSAAPAVVGPRGAWTAQVGANEAGALSGAWTLTFTDAELLYRNPGGASFGQPIAYSPDQLTLKPDDCPSGTGPGTYRWAETGDTLTLTVISDPSACRVAVLAASPLTRAAQP